MASSVMLVQNNEAFQTYNVLCFGNNVTTTVTHSPNKVSQWIADMEAYFAFSGTNTHRIIGLDIEWRPTFSAGENPVATIQLCVNDRCLIFQILQAGYVPRSLINLMSNYAYTFVGVGVNKDIEKLHRDFGFGGNANAVDLGTIAAERYERVELKTWGLKDLCGMVLGKEIEKPFRVTTSAWDSIRLSVDQVKYACLDAVVSYQLGVKLLHQPVIARVHGSVIVFPTSLE